MSRIGVLGAFAAAASVVALATRAWERGDDVQTLILLAGIGVAGALSVLIDSRRERAIGRPPPESKEVSSMSRAIDLRPSPVGALAGAVDDPVVVIDAYRKVVHLNSAARGMLGNRVGIGRPLPAGAGIERALERARASGGMAVAMLRPTGATEMSARVVDLGLDVGAAFVFTGLAQRESTAAAPRTMGHRRGPDPDEPLAVLPMTAVWTASTSTSVGEGRLIAFGCERLSGERVFRTMSLDMLFDPGVDPERAATERHGIDENMIRGSRDAAAALNDIEGMLRGTVLVAAGIERVLDPFRRECAGAGRPEVADHPTLDLALLAARADDGDPGRDLAALKTAFGVAPMPRYGVFAPVHETAELTSRILAALEGRGVVTLADALALETVQRARVAQA